MSTATRYFRDLSSLLVWALFAWSLSASAESTPAFFRVAQDQYGNYWLRDPDGSPFFSTGINVVTPLGEKENFTGKYPYHDAWQAKMSLSDWVQQTKARLKDWGFNSLGGWSDSQIFNHRIPYTQVVGCRAHYGPYGKDNPVSRFNLPVMNPADYWDPDFEKAASLAAAEATLGRVEDPMLIGYFLDNEVNWGQEHRTAEHLFDHFLARKESFARAEIIRELKEKYGSPDIDLLNKNWHTQFKSYEEIGPDPQNTSEAYLADRSAFLKSHARKYYSICSRELRKRDPNHLLMGERTFGVLSKPEVVEVAGETQDIISVNYYFYNSLAKVFIERLEPGAVKDVNWLAEFHRLSRKPILISEFGFMDFGISPFVFKWSNGQKGRAQDTADFIARSFAEPYIVGYHVFEFSDEPLFGRKDTENSHMGLVSTQNEPYPDMISAFQKQATKISEIEAQAKLKAPEPLQFPSD